MKKFVRRDHATTMPAMVRALAYYAECSETEAAEALMDVIRAVGHDGSFLYSVEGDGLAAIEFSGGCFSSAVNALWWKRSGEKRIAAIRYVCGWVIPIPKARSLFIRASKYVVEPSAGGARLDFENCLRRGEADISTEIGETYVDSRAGSAWSDTTVPGYLNQDNPRYSMKLAAAVMAWEHVADAKGKHPRQALKSWLKRNASKFSLTNEGIEQCATVANWRPKGGAPRTPRR